MLNIEVKLMKLKEDYEKLHKKVQDKAKYIERLQRQQMAYKNLLSNKKTKCSKCNNKQNDATTEKNVKTFYSY